MIDQSTLFTAKGISATYVSDKESTNKKTKHRIVKCKYQLAFISPVTSTEWRMLSGDYYQ